MISGPHHRTECLSLSDDHRRLFRQPIPPPAPDLSMSPMMWPTRTPYPRRTGVTLIELLVVIAIISILVTLSLPGVQAAREMARRAMCGNHIRQLALGVQMHANTFGSIPGNGGFTPESTIVSAAGTPEHISTRDLVLGTFHQWGIGVPGKKPRQQPGSWAYAVLPYVEQSTAYQNVDVGALQPLYLCPTRGRRPPLPPVDDAFGEYESAGLAWSQTDYCGNAKLMPNYPDVVPLSQIGDGLSQTLVLGEKAFDRVVHGPTSWFWDEPIFSGGSKGTARAGLVIVPDGFNIAFKENWGSPHPGGAMFARADGSTTSNASSAFRAARMLSARAVTSGCGIFSPNDHS